MSWWPHRGQPPSIRLLELGARVGAVAAVCTYGLAAFAVVLRRNANPFLGRAIALIIVLTLAASALAWLQLRRGSTPPWTRPTLIVFSVAVTAYLAFGSDPTTVGRRPGGLGGPEGEALFAGIVVGAVPLMAIGLSWGARRLLVLSVAFAGLVATLSAIQHLDAARVAVLGAVELMLCVLAAISAVFTRRLQSLLQRINHSRDTYAAIAVTRERLRFSHDLDDLARSDLGAIAATARRAEGMLADPTPDTRQKTVAALLLIRHLVDEAGDRMRRLAVGYRGDTFDEVPNSPGATPATEPPRQPPGAMRARVVAARGRATDVLRVERYVRWYFYLLIVIPVTTPMLRLSHHWPYSRVIAFGELVHLAIAAYLVHVGLRVRPAVPGVRPAFALLSFGLLMASLLSYGPDLAHQVANNALPVTLLLGSIPTTLGVLSLSWRWSRVMTLGTIMVATAVAVEWHLDAVPHDFLLGFLIGTLFVGNTTNCLQGPAVWWILDGAWSLHGAREATAQLAVARERLQFSRELHDGRGRLLAAVAVKSQLAVQYLRHEDPRVAEEMRGIIELIDELESIKPLEAPGDLDFFDELRAAQALIRPLGMQLQVSGADEFGGRLPDPTNACLAAVVREAVTNVIRHSSARVIRVELDADAMSEANGPGHTDDQAVVLRVSNDGVPAEGSSGSGRSMGLLGLRERVAALGGTFEAGRHCDEFVVEARLVRSAETVHS